MIMILSPSLLFLFALLLFHVAAHPVYPPEDSEVENNELLCVRKDEDRRGRRKERSKRESEKKPEIPFRDYANVVLAEQKKKK